jgi:YD repeat-containing protein
MTVTGIPSTWRYTSVVSRVLITSLLLTAASAAAQHSAPPNDLRPWKPALTKYTMASGISGNFGFWPSCGSGPSPMSAAQAWAPEDQAVWNRYWQMVGESLGGGWYIRITSQVPQSCTPIVRSAYTEILEVGLSGCPDNGRRVGFASQYDYRNNPTNFTFRTAYVVPSCSVLKTEEGFNPYSGGAWSQTVYMSPPPPYNLYALCPEGWYSSVHFVFGTTPWCLPLAGDYAPDPDKNAGGPKGAGDGSPHTCNPVSIGTGNKYLFESDYSPSTPNSLSWERHYNHHVARSGPVLSTRWTHTYSRSIATAGNDRAYIYRPDGRAVTARLTSPAITSGRQRWTVEANSGYQLWRTFDASSQPTGWIVQSASRPELETYYATGQLMRVASQSGYVRDSTYSDGTAGANGGFVLDDNGQATSALLPAGLLIRVSDSFGKSLRLGYNRQSQPILLNDLAGGVFRYAYGSAVGNLTGVVFPGGGSKQYIYGEAAHIGSIQLPYAVTGVIDESGVRSASYSYDNAGRATISQRWSDAAQTQSVGRASLAYVVRPAGGMSEGEAVSATVTDANGTSRSYNLTTILGVVKQTSQSQPAGSGCGPSSSALTYDAQANVASRTDFNNNKVCYAYDLSRNLETKRVEGVTAAAVCSTALSSPPTGARIISTQWHPDWRLETRIAEPKKLTTITYNGQGATCAPSTVLVDGKPPAVICTRTEQGTTDETGAAGFAATVTGTARTWRYTYTTYGRVLTATDPNNRTTTYSYHPDNDADLGKRGNVASITNAAIHTTYLTDYNPHGQPTRIVDPNGVVTVLTYDPRMRLTSRTVGNEATVFGYDPVGQMTSVNLPDGARLTYTYDAAHRLTAINDHKGNRIDYTLDAMGNRITEKTKDPGGVLVGNIARVIDALNRVQQVTGAAQ